MQFRPLSASLLMDTIYFFLLPLALLIKNGEYWIVISSKYIVFLNCTVDCSGRWQRLRSSEIDETSQTTRMRHPRGTRPPETEIRGIL
ncbi:hypothetical protein PB01_20760 [Psychrobacillus glaciei]|uniref:Uncharacterized protein n=1 Tax=Psychrobacillus glaciei TaxID=2283160 RepID=A0A5J6SSP3_9BACI|nr:hypothetical protein PB01_20760 [Psychrobacillus glaciei]